MGGSWPVGGACAAMALMLSETAGSGWGTVGSCGSGCPSKGSPVDAGALKGFRRLGGL